MIDCQTLQTGLFIDYECPCSVIISSKGRVNKGAELYPVQPVEVVMLIIQPTYL